MKSPVEVEILIATYNGEQYLIPQLDSILSQTYQDFSILIRDDGSTDSTLSIIQDYQKQHPEKIQLIPQDGSAPGLIQNFSKLIESSSAPYLMFSDQDDYWLPQKIEIMLDRLRRLETTTSPDTPILVHSDLIVVDSELNEIVKSLWRYIGINPERDSLPNLLVQNIVTGCASIFNRALADLASPFPPQAMMHDWWLALVASSLGVLGKVDTPTVLYRQHGANTLGARPFSWKPSYLANRIKALFQPERNIILEKFILQAKIFHQQYRRQIPPQHLEALTAFKEIKSKGFLSKRLTLLKYDMLRGQVLQNVGLMIRI